MTKKYFIPIILLVGISLVLVLLPPKKTYNELQPEELLRQVISPSRFISPEIVADRMINKDPSLVLVDVRSREEFAAFSLPGSLNIPLTGMCTPEEQGLLKQKGVDFIFYSNGDILADQAWILCKRKGSENIFVLKGGLNGWFDAFFVIKDLPETASASEIELYHLRNAVRQYFTGGETEVVKKQEAEIVPLVPKTKNSAAEGGC